MAAGGKNPWTDPNVQSALGEGLDPGEIWLLPCPSCGNHSFWNQGRSFACQWCDFRATPDWIDETVDAGDALTLADYAALEAGGD